MIFYCLDHWGVKVFIKLFGDDFFVIGNFT